MAVNTSPKQPSAYLSLRRPSSLLNVPSDVQQASENHLSPGSCRYCVPGLGPRSSCTRLTAEKRHNYSLTSASEQCLETEEGHIKAPGQGSAARGQWNVQSSASLGEVQRSLQTPRVLEIQHEEACPSLRPISEYRRPIPSHYPTLRQGDDNARDSTDTEVHLSVHPALRGERPLTYPAVLRTAASMNSVSKMAPAPGDDPWTLAHLSPPSPIASVAVPRPRASLHRLSSLDRVMSYREEKALWKRTSSLDELSRSVAFEKASKPDCLTEENQASSPDSKLTESNAGQMANLSDEESATHAGVKRKNKFRNSVSEIGFCVTIAMTQFLAEYLISGFAIALPKLAYRTDLIIIGQGTLGLFWPASLLTFVLSSALLAFARISDIRGGYEVFLLGIIWLGIWTLVPGFYTSQIVLDISRAMQGLAIAAFTPSTFTMVSTFYPEAGPRRNFVLGLYSGCAPLGFFAGNLVASMLPADQPQWYLWIASIMAFTTAITAYLTVPHDWTDRKRLGLQMDWVGAIAITSGLILVNYALAYEPAANTLDRSRNGFSYPEVYGPFTAGTCCLIFATGWEGWVATSPLLPLEFLRPKGVLAFSLAGLCFYGAYGVWLYEAARYFQSPTGVTHSREGLQGAQLALWFLPTAIGGVVLSVIGGSIMHIVPMSAMLFVSALAWVMAPLLLAVCPIPLNYWSTVLPSMLCATIGLDITYTLSLVHFSSSQPKKYQGLCGAVCSVLINLGMSYSLPLSEILERSVSNFRSCFGIYGDEMHQCMNESTNWTYRATFFFAAASAGLGLILCVLFVRFPRRTISADRHDEERPHQIQSETATLADDHDAEKEQR